MSTLSQEAALVHEALLARGLETPLRAPVREMDSETRKREIAGHMTQIMQLLNLDLEDDSLMETPHRIAKMYVDEIFSGLDYANFPKITVIENKMKVDEMVTVRDITLTSTCCVRRSCTCGRWAKNCTMRLIFDRPITLSLGM